MLKKRGLLLRSSGSGEVGERVQGAEDDVGESETHEGDNHRAETERNKGVIIPGYDACAQHMRWLEWLGHKSKNGRLRLTLLYRGPWRRRRPSESLIQRLEDVTCSKRLGVPHGRHTVAGIHSLVPSAPL